MPVIIRIASVKKLMDVPDNRKIHKAPIPSLGGFGVFAGFLLAVLLAVPFKASAGLQYYAAAGFILFLVGLKDDVVVITPLKKFLGQLAAAAIVINVAGLRLVSLHGIFGITELPYVVSLILSYFAFILVVNAFNLIDGVDGLAGTLGVVSALVFGVYFYFAKEPLYAIMGLSLVGALSAFLVFNYTPAKIFMGDTGSMLVGLVNAILVLHFIRVADAPQALVPVTSAPMIGVAILAVPLFDTLRVFTIRIFLHRRSPFSPDRNHIHHLLLDCGFSHPAVTSTLVIYNLVLIAGAFALRDEGNYVLLTGLVVTSLSFSGLVAFFRQPRRPFVVMKNVGTPLPVPPADGAVVETVQRKNGSPLPQKAGAVKAPSMHPIFSIEEE
ncbi:MraY family glycosyltransferase [Dinghuibacter silviterrae]|nr:MraY family glycosyltransferase [Dinghuibacter silviterrae]